MLDAYRRFRAAGGRPDHLILTGWHPYPLLDLPEDAAERFPFMKDVLQFSRLGGVVENESRKS